MDYLLSGSGENNMSLQDMIECDMKAEYSEHIDDDTIMHGDFHSSLGMVDNLSTADLLNHNGLDSYGLAEDISEVTPMSVDAKGDQAWINTVNLSSSVLHNDSINDEVFQMVNPQTGLPVQVRTVSQPQQMNNLSAGSGSHAPTIQYVHTISDATFQQALQGLQQQQQQAVSNTQLHQFQNTHLISQALSNGTTVTLSSVSYPQIIHRSSTISQSSPVTQQLLNNNHLKKVIKSEICPGKVYPKPVYSYSCLIAMSLKNSETGALPVSEIYSFMTENFPYFKTAPDGWKNSVRHNLSLNKCFEKIENPKATGNTRKGCLWGLNPARIDKMDDEIAKWRKKDLDAIHRSMSNPDILEKLEIGNTDLKNCIKRRILASQQEALMNAPSPASSAGSPGPICVAAASSTHSDTISADIQLSMIEIKPYEGQMSQTPVKFKMEPIFTIKPEPMDAIGAVGGGLTADDLSVLDTSLSMDPTLGDAALQSSLWEELGAEGINLDDIPLLSFGPTTSSSSPLTVQANKSGLMVVW